MNLPKGNIPSRVFSALGRTLLGLSFVFAAGLICSAWTGCTTDCLYESYTNSDGQAACARVCPLEDAEGNEVVDANGKTVFEAPEKGEDVNRINCDPFRSVNSLSTSTSSSSTSSGTTASTSSTGTTDDGLS